MGSAGCAAGHPHDQVAPERLPGGEPLSDLPHPVGVVDRRPRGSPPGGRRRPDVGWIGRLQQGPGTGSSQSLGPLDDRHPARRRATEGGTARGSSTRAHGAPARSPDLTVPSSPGIRRRAGEGAAHHDWERRSLPTSDPGPLRVHQRPAATVAMGGAESRDLHPRPDGRRGRQQGRRRSAGRRCARTPLVT